MSDFKPIDTDGKTDREILLALCTGVNQVHNCVDGFRIDQAKVNKDASEKRHKLNNAVFGLQGEVKALTIEVGEIKTAQEVDSGRITKLAKTFGAEAWDKGEKKHAPLASWGVLKVGATVLGCLAGAVLLYQIIVPVLITLHHTLMTAHG